jgi:peptide/nickel transport system substrate-binding protein
MGVKDVAIIALIVILIASWGYFLIQPAPTGLKPLTSKDTLIVARDISDAVSLDPARAYEFSSCAIVNQLYDKLVDLKPPDYQEIEPEIATSWRVLDDNVTWEFKIRTGISFPDGTPINATVVKFSLDRLLTLEQMAAWVISQFEIQEIKVVDEYTLQIRLGYVVAERLFLSCLAFTAGSIVNPTVVKAHEKEGDMASEWMTDHSAGSGPFILEKWDREVEIVLVANENYWGKKPEVKRVIFKHYPESTTQMLALKKGDVDIAWDLTSDQIEEVKGVLGMKVIRVPSFFKDYLGMNVNATIDGKKPLSDNRVRDAIRYAIDYDAILSRMKGTAIQLQTIIESGIPGYNPALPYYRNVEKAKALLAEAGYPDGFTVELIHQPTVWWPDIATIIKSSLADIGITVNLHTMAAAEMYETYRAQNHQLILGEWGADYPDPDNLAKAFADYTVKQLAYRNTWYDDYASNLTKMAAKELDTSKRLAMYEELTTYVLHNGPYAILYQGVYQYGVRTWVEGFYPDPTFFLMDFSVVYKENVYG